MTTTATTHVYLLDPNDVDTEIGDLYFASKEAAHIYMAAECPEQHYCFAEDRDRFYDEN